MPFASLRSFDGPTESRATPPFPTSRVGERRTDTRGTGTHAHAPRSKSSGLGPNPRNQAKDCRWQGPRFDPCSITLRDNGLGSAPENLLKIFPRGFTTKQDGHGFGLHSGANAAKEMGGRLTPTARARSRRGVRPGTAGEFQGAEE